MVDTLAGDIMNGRVVYAKTTWPIDRIASRMFRGGFSQLPVRQDGKIVGLVTERMVHRWLTTVNKMYVPKRQSLESSGLRLEPKPPIVTAETKLEAVIDQLRRRPLLLVRKGDEIAGVITKADLLKVLLEERVAKLW